MKMASSSTVSILCLILTSAIYTAYAFQTTFENLNDENNDDLRISSNQFQGPINYHSITPGNHFTGESQNNDQIPTNHIGKLLVPLPAKSQQQNIVAERPQVKKIKQKYTHVTTSKPILSPIARQPTSLLEQPYQSSFRRLAPYGYCHWMSLRDFKNISLDTSELIIRDAEDQPCYLLTMRAFIKWNDDNYFPLNNLKVYPHTNRVVFDSPSDGVSAFLPLNCSFMAGVGGTSIFVPIQKSNRSFREEIIISVDCGYLILQTRGDGSYLTLETLSLYQNADIASQVPRAKISKRSSRLIPQMRSEHLVFSTEGTQNSPLFTMPLISRYICQNRIVLTGNNSMRLVLDRFELQRLSYPSSGEIGETRVAQEAGPVDGYSRLMRKRSNFGVSRDTTTVYFKNPLTLVTRCPNPTLPSFHLNSMTEIGFYGNNDKMKNGVADKWAPVKSFAMHQKTFLWSDAKLATFNYVMTLCLIQYIVKQLMFRH